MNKLFLLFFISIHCLNAQQLVVSNKKIINSSNNQEVVLNAVNFGNWMVMEGYMMNSVNQAPAQHNWKQKLNTLIGTQNTANFYDAWLTKHVANTDIIQIKSWGFNAVRVPIHYEYFVNSGTPDVWSNYGFTLLDNIISWCSSEGIYVIIDLHAAPGGQSNNAISDYDATKPSLWESTLNKNKTIELWRKISERYKNEVWVAGYDLINEPAWDLPGGIDLRNLYNSITTAIRNNSDNHILFIEGNWYSNDYAGLTPAWDPNMVYVFHKYWSDASTVDITWILNFRDAQNRPIWCGEHGENSNDHFTRIVETFNANNIGFSWWPMKKFESVNCFSSANFPTGYNNLLSYLGGTNPTLNPTVAYTTLLQLADNVKIENSNINYEVLRSIFVQPGNRNTAPFSSSIPQIGNTSPTRIFTSNYDQGMNGHAYSDLAWEENRLTTGFYTAWNNGWVYRNGGVDIERSSDISSNGYSVGWFDRSEWMKFTVNINNSGTYNAEFRVANGGSASAAVQIQNAEGTLIYGTAVIPPTGSWSSWQTITKVVTLPTTGLQTIRIVSIAGSSNINSVNFSYINSTFTTPQSVVQGSNVINLKGINEKYVTFSNTTTLMTCSSSTNGTNEKFTVIELGDGYSALKGSNNKYVTLNSADNKLYCNATSIGDSQKFILNNLSGAYSLKGYNNFYVSSENGSASGMTCTRTIPGTWEFFNWGIFDTVVLAIDSFENPDKNFLIYPNPAQDFIYLKSLSEDNFKIDIFDTSGRKVLQSFGLGLENKIDISSFNAGFYVLKITGSHHTESIQFIKNELDRL